MHQPCAIWKKSLKSNYMYGSIKKDKYLQINSCKLAQNDLGSENGHTHCPGHRVLFRAWWRRWFSVTVCRPGRKHLTLPVLFLRANAALILRLFNFTYMQKKTKQEAPHVLRTHSREFAHLQTRGGGGAGSTHRHAPGIATEGTWVSTFSLVFRDGVRNV